MSSNASRDADLSACLIPAQRGKITRRSSLTHNRLIHEIYFQSKYKNSRVQQHKNKRNNETQNCTMQTTKHKPGAATAAEKEESAHQAQLRPLPLRRQYHDHHPGTIPLCYHRQLLAQPTTTTGTAIPLPLQHHSTTRQITATTTAAATTQRQQQRCLLVSEQVAAM